MATITGSSSDNGMLSGTALADSISGLAGNDNLFGFGGDDTLNGGADADVMVGGTGNDIYNVDNIVDVISEESDAGIDIVESVISYALPNNVENLTFTGTATGLIGTGNELNNYLIGNNAANSLIGSLGNDTLDGGLEADYMEGGVGDDNYFVDHTNDVIFEIALQGTDNVSSSVDYTLTDNIENLTLTGIAITAKGNSLNNIITGNSVKNSLLGGLGDDIYYVQNTDDSITENSSEGTDIVYSTVSYTLADNIEELTLTGTVAINNYGNSLSNRLTGNAQSNIMNGGQNADTLIGGAGNDTYIVDNVGDIVIEDNPTSSTDVLQTDEVKSSVSYTLTDNVENLTLTGSTGLTTSLDTLNGTGNSLNNVLIGNDGINILDGGLGTDYMSGAKGSDTYLVDNTADRVIETETSTSTSEIDEIISSVTYTLETNSYVEKLTLTGTNAISGTANALNNILTGNEAVNTLTGGLGNDTYYIQNTDDVIIEQVGGGTADVMYSTVAVTLAANVEILYLTGTETINSIGNSNDNYLNGNDAANILDGQLGIDTMVGGKGDDTYYIDNIGDIVIENSNEGIDTIISSMTYTLSVNLENLTLTGTSALNGYGNSLNNILTDNTAKNILDGGLGNDIYVVQNTNDEIREDSILSSEIDEVRTAISYTLGDTNLENLTLMGTEAINGTGNTLNNTLIGNSAANILNGGEGIDTMMGGLGDDTYIVDLQDSVTENADAGIDTVTSSLASYTLGANLENLILFNDTIGGATNGTGNTLNNVLTGNAVANNLDGNLGADTLQGGQGNDVYVVDNTGDIVIEIIDEGIVDTVNSSIDYTLTDYVENLTLTSTTAINGTGNTLDNLLNGNAAANTLDGGTGGDTLIGGLGNDTYSVDNSSDVVTETSVTLTEIDEVQSLVAYTLNNNVENLILMGTDALNGTGNTLNNVLTGNSLSNNLNGSTGADTLIGGIGNDIYSIDNTADIIIENTDEGIDKVNSLVTLTLSDNIENLTLLGTTLINGTGNASNNRLIGNTTTNILDGGEGKDTLIGGLGDDTYFIDTPNELIIENDNEGIDKVKSLISLTLAANLESLTLIGTNTINGTGNSISNTLTGNVAANTLNSGSGGNNILNGGGGNDTLNGGTGNDTLNGGTGNDVLKGGLGVNSLTGGLGNDIYYIDSTGDVVIEDSFKANEIDIVNSSINYTLTNNVEELILTGSIIINGMGNSGNNTLTGNAVANSLSGDAGNDILDAGAGNDSLNGGADNDTLNAGAGDDTLDGGLGIDYLNGGIGNDTYFIDNNSNMIIENTDEGIDVVNSSITLVLADNIENLVLTGTVEIDGAGNILQNILTGNEAANKINGGANNDILIGNAGDDTLNGGLNADNLQGESGNDTYIVDDLNDVVSENSGSGTDTVSSSINYTLVANVENLSLTGTATLNGIGNTQNNILTGNSSENLLNGGLGHDNLIGNKGDDTLDGGLDADTVNGGLGNDTYFIDSLDDIVIEKTSQGVDIVNSSVNFILQSNVENLTLIGTNTINGTGNQFANILTGNDATNMLNGRMGADTLIGGLGNDIYRVDNTSDQVIESSTLITEIDRVNSFVNYTLTANVENLSLFGTNAINGTGNGLANILEGNGIANSLVGGLGDDTLTGGANRDTLMGGAGNDSLSGDIGNDGLSGDAGNDTLLGGSGNDTLDGGTGADSLIGGLGNDIYSVENLNDNVIENSGEGIDLINSSISIALVDNVENLTLMGITALNGTGNSQNNSLTGNEATNLLNGNLGNDLLIGNAGIDTLDGGDGNDRLNGGLGNDLLTGGDGNDVFIFDTVLSHNTDKITDYSVAYDTIGLSSALFNSNAKNNLTLATDITGTSTTKGFLNYDTDSGNLYYDSNGVTAGGFVTQIAILGIDLQLTTADFIMIQFLVFK